MIRAKPGKPGDAKLKGPEGLPVAKERNATGIFMKRNRKMLFIAGAMFLASTAALGTVSFAWIIVSNDVNMNSSVQIGAAENVATLEANVYKNDFLDSSSSSGPIAYYYDEDSKLNATNSAADKGAVDVSFVFGIGTQSLLDLYGSEYGISEWSIPVHYLEIKIMKENFSAYMNGTFSLTSSSCFAGYVNGSSSVGSSSSTKWLYRSLVVKNDTANPTASAWNDTNRGYLQNVPTDGSTYSPATNVKGYGKVLSDDSFSLFSDNNNFLDSSVTRRDQLFIDELPPVLVDGVPTTYYSMTMLCAVSLDPLYLIEFIQDNYASLHSSSAYLSFTIKFTLSFTISNDYFTEVA